MYNTHLFNHYYSRIENLWWRWWKMKINYYLIGTSKTRWLQKCKWRCNPFLYKYDEILFILKKYSYKFFLFTQKWELLDHYTLHNQYTIFHVFSYIYVCMYMYEDTHTYNIHIYFTRFTRYVCTSSDAICIQLFLYLFLLLILWSKFQDWKHFL